MMQTFDLWTDIASFCIFDAEYLQSKGVGQCDAHLASAGVLDGTFAIFDIGADCSFRVKCSMDALPPKIMNKVTDLLGMCGVVVRSGQVYISGMDRPGDSVELLILDGAGSFVSLPPGEYNVFCYEMETDELRRNFVVVFYPRTEPFRGIA